MERKAESKAWRKALRRLKTTKEDNWKLAGAWVYKLLDVFVINNIEPFCYL